MAFRLATLVYLPMATAVFHLGKGASLFGLLASNIGEVSLVKKGGITGFPY
jgi:hypothetical protein